MRSAPRRSSQSAARSWRGARLAGQPGVRGVAEQAVQEAHLDLAGDRRPPLAPQDAPALQAAQQRLRLGRLDPPDHRTPSSQATSPSTAASCRNAFSAGGSASTRAATMPRTVSGSAAGSAPRCTIIRTHSRANRGLPPARSTSSRAASGRAPGSARCSSSSSTAAALQRAEVDALGHGRARPAGAPLEQLRARRHHHEQPGIRRRLDRSSMKSSSAGSAWCRSSSTSTAGRAGPRPPGTGATPPWPPRGARGRRRWAARAAAQVAAHPDRVRRHAGAGHGGVELAPGDGRLVRRQDAGLLGDDLAQGAEGRAVAVGRNAAAPPGLSRGVSAAMRRGSATSRLLPMPASPVITSRRARPCAPSSKAAASRARWPPGPGTAARRGCPRAAATAARGPASRRRAAPCPWRGRTRRARTRSRRGSRGRSARRPGSRRARRHPRGATPC